MADPDKRIEDLPDGDFADSNTMLQSSSGTSQKISQAKIKEAILSEIPSGLLGLSEQIVAQLVNINTSLISEMEWIYVSLLNQHLTTSSNVAFHNISTTGKVDGVDLQILDSTVSGISSNLNSFPQALTDLTSAEVTQIGNIGNSTISPTQWGLIGGIDQSLSSSSIPTYQGVNITSAIPKLIFQSANNANCEIQFLEGTQLSKYGGGIRYNGQSNRLECGSYNNNSFVTAFYAIRGSSSIFGSGAAYKPNGGSWGSVSDRRLKKDIKPIEGALDSICKLSGVHFAWKDSGELSGGFIAQEVEEVFPNWISEQEEEDTSYSSLEIDGKIKQLTLPFEFDAYIVESIKELSKEIKSIKSFLMMDK